MHSRNTRSNKNKELVTPSVEELGRLERENRKAKKVAKMVNPVILIQGENGNFADQEGRPYNAQGQRLDDQGNPIIPAAVAVDVRPENAIQENAGGVDRHPPAGVARHPVPAARVQTLGDYNRPDAFYQNRSAIRLPAIERNDFELKPAFYALVGQHPFHGLSHEHPMDHIEKFEDLVTSIKANGVSYDYLFCKLFPYSLGGDAAYWLKQLPTGSLGGWDETKKAFLCHFYDDARSDDLRNSIQQFTQGPTEAFRSAWIRFRAYQRDCPHHGFSKVQLLGIFFRGVEWRYQMALDSASNGNFKTRSPEEAEMLIENLASSNSTKNADFERQKVAGNYDGKQLADLKNKLDSVHNILVNKKTVQFAAEVETYEPEEGCEEDVNYIGGSGFQGQRFGNQQGRGGYSGYGQRNNYSTNQNSTGFGTKPQYEKPFQSSNQNQQAQSSGNYTRTYGSSSYQALPARTEAEDMRAMLDQILEGQQKMTVVFNGKIDAVYSDLSGKIEALNIHVKKLDVQVAQTASAVKQQEGNLPGKTDANPRYACNAIYGLDDEELEPQDELAAEMSSHEVGSATEVQVSIDTSYSVSIDTGHQPEKTESNPLAETTEHKPELPPPQKARQSPEVVECVKLLAKLSLANTSKDTTAPPLKLLPKLKDPGRFVVSCSIGGVLFRDCLCDSGSNINIMSRDIARRLGLRDIQQSRMMITFADASAKGSQGFKADLQVKIGNCVLPTDFHIVEMSRGLKMPLILGRSFMATAGAMVDLPNKRMSLLNIDKDVYYLAAPDPVIPPRHMCGAASAAKEPDPNPAKLPCDTAKVWRVKVKEEPPAEVVKLKSQVTLIPVKVVGDFIEYKLKKRGSSSPFSKVRGIITPEIREKGQAAVDALMKRTLELSLLEHGAKKRIPPDPESTGHSNRA